MGSVRVFGLAVPLLAARRGAVGAAERRVSASVWLLVPSEGAGGVSLPMPASSPPARPGAVHDSGLRSTRIRR
jgi:hypothetical protein